MFKVLIADDEPLVVHGLSSQIDWEAFGLELAGTAGCGSDVIAMMEREPAHLLITDVCMPKMDGLTLIKRAKAINPSLRCIVVSAFSEFDYVRQALQLGVENYLLKPIDGSELCDTLTQSLQNLQRDRTPGVIPSPDLLAFRTNILDRWVNGGIQEFELVERADMLRIDLSAAEYRVCVLEPIEQASEGRRFAAATALSELCRRTLPGAFACDIFVDGSLRVVAILYGGVRPGGDAGHSGRMAEQFGEPVRPSGDAGHSGRAAEQFGEPVQPSGDAGHSGRAAEQFGGAGERPGAGRPTASPADAAERELRLICREAAAAGIPAFAAIGPAVPSSAGVSASYAAAALYRLYRHLEPAEQTVRCAALPEGGRQSPGHRPRLQALQQALQEGDIRQANRLAERELESYARLPYFAAADGMLPFVLTIVQAVAESAGASSAVPEPLAGLLARFPELGATERLGGWLAETIEEAVQEIRRRKGSFHLLVHLMLEQIHRHYETELSLKLLAAGFNVSPAYLGRLFKEETGQYFNDYLTRIRLQASRELLTGTELKISEIVLRIGIPNQSYFNRVFRKMFGLSPVEFRRRPLER